jgi:hypothetical protein
MKLHFATRKAARSFNATRNSKGYAGTVGDIVKDNSKALSPSVMHGKRYYVSLNSK